MPKIYWDNVSDVDHAVLLPTGEIVGNSFIATATMEGKTTKDEQVVLDFSLGKKNLKAFLDATVDHKLWVTSEAQLTYLEDGMTEVSMGKTKLVLPVDAVYKIPESIEQTAYTMCVPAFIRHIQTLVCANLSDILSKSIGLNVVFAAADVPDVADRLYFRYAHGLPQSSSYGCKNIAHGHLSYIELIPRDQHTLTIPERMACLNKIMQDLVKGDTIFFDNDCVLYFVTANDDQRATVEALDPVGYTLTQDVPSSRGTQKLEFNPDKLLDLTLLKQGNMYVHILTSYSTIENLGDFFRTVIDKVCPGLLKSYKVRVSEGLSKGTIIE